RKTAYLSRKANVRRSSRACGGDAKVWQSTRENRMDRRIATLGSGSATWGQAPPGGARPRSALHACANGFDRGWVLERREVAWVVADYRRAHRAAQDLGAARLRQRCREADLGRGEGLAELLRAAGAQAHPQLLVRLGPRAQHAEAPDDLA